jgi:hypothetical protein
MKLLRLGKQIVPFIAPSNANQRFRSAFAAPILHPDHPSCKAPIHPRVTQ